MLPVTGARIRIELPRPIVSVRVRTATANTVADGMTCRVPDPDALAMIMVGADRIVRVSDAEIVAAMRALWTDTHNLAEGAGAAAFAALMQEREHMQGKRVAVILCGGNVDLPLALRVLAPEGIPEKA